jgi:serine/threonine-protein kinase
MENGSFFVSGIQARHKKGCQMIVTGKASDPAMSELQNLGKYQIEGILGKGAMGVVYKAFDPNIARRVAIKTIHKSLLNTDMGREMLARFRTEAQAVGRLTHPNIVNIFEFDQDQGTPYFVMEFVEGKDLKTVVKEGKLFSTEEIVQTIDPILQALAYTHELGIVHRDIKPANVFITSKGVVKLADFGIARVDNSEMTQIGTVLGTPSYMSPEQCIGSAVDARSDLFSVGVMLYELLTGQKPFRGDQSTVIMTNVINTDPEPPSRINKAVPAAFDSILKKALAKNVNQRYQKADDFRADLARLAGGTASGTAGLSRGVMATGVAAVVLVAVLAGGGGWWASRTVEPVVPQAAVEEPGSRLTAEQQAKIADLLDVAKAHLMVGRFVSPQGSNAWEAYGLVLSLDPENAAALEGQEKARENFFKRAGILIKTGDREAARQHLELAKVMFPDDDATRDLESEIAD